MSSTVSPELNTGTSSGNINEKKLCLKGVVGRHEPFDEAILIFSHLGCPQNSDKRSH